MQPRDATHAAQVEAEIQVRLVARGGAEPTQGATRGPTRRTTESGSSTFSSGRAKHRPTGGQSPLRQGPAVGKIELTTLGIDDLHRLGFRDTEMSHQRSPATCIRSGRCQRRPGMRRSQRAQNRPYGVQTEQAQGFVVGESHLRKSINYLTPSNLRPILKRHFLNRAEKTPRYETACRRAHKKYYAHQAVSLRHPFLLASH